MADELSRRAFLAGAATWVAVGPALAAGKTRGAEMTGSFDVGRFVDDVKRANGEGQAAVDEVLARSISDPGRIIAGLGEPNEAGLNVLHRADDITILNVIWAPLMVLLPHNHNMWASIGIYTGREDNILWQQKGSTIEAIGAASLSEKEVFPLASDGVHSVINPIRRLTGAIHIYGGDFFAPGRSEWDAETLAERPFDVDALRAGFREANKRFESSR
jgi:predicted metal-dependent enzyme (double-stranded beta helix superfamily)